MSVMPVTPDHIIERRDEMKALLRCAGCGEGFPVREQRIGESEPVACPNCGNSAAVREAEE